MNRSDFLAIAHRAPADKAGLHDYLYELEGSGLRESQPAAFAGIITALTDRFPDAALWTVDDLAAMAATASATLQDLPDNQGWNDVYLARWAACGSLQPLAELVRRAMNRDGSTAAESVGMDAVVLLYAAVEVDPLLVAELAANNFRLTRFRFGSYPPGSFSLPLAPSATRVAAARPGRLAGVVGVPVQPSPVTVLPPAAARSAVPSGDPVADRESGTVNIGSVKLSISAAVRLRDNLTRAVTSLVRPDEGFTWLDDHLDPQARSLLIDLDGTRGRGLPESGGGFLHGEVTQIPSRGPDPNAGKYTGRLYNRSGGFSDFATGVDDMNAAKFMLAERVRQELRT